jgi:hypothetical protein
LIQVDTEGAGTIIGPGTVDLSSLKQEERKPEAVLAAERRLTELFLNIKVLRAQAQLLDVYEDEANDIREFLAFYESTKVDM